MGRGNAGEIICLGPVRGEREENKIMLSK